jgi:hypothetical protein
VLEWRLDKRKAGESCRLSEGWVILGDGSDRLEDESREKASVLEQRFSVRGDKGEEAGVTVV